MTPLPDDLALLGAELEAAAARAVRRRARRQAVLNGAAAVLVAAPLAVAVSATDIAPDSPPDLSRTTAAPPEPPNLPVVASPTVRFVHHEALPCAAGGLSCARPAAARPPYLPAGRS